MSEDGEETEVENTEQAETTEDATQEEAETEAKDPESITDAISQAGDSPLADDSEEAEASEESTAEDSKDDSQDDLESAAGAPEEYADFELPDGLIVTDERLDDMAGVMKGLDLSQDQAKDVMNQFVEWQRDLGVHQEQLVLEHKKAGLEQLRKDPRVIGPDGDKFKESARLVRMAVDKFAGEGEDGLRARAALVDSGVIDLEPELFIVLMGVGRALLPDAIDPQGDYAIGLKGDKPPQERMGWGDMDKGYGLDDANP